VVAAIGIVGGFVAWAIKRTTTPLHDREWNKKRLRQIASTPRSQISIDMAEDGLVLSRQLELPALEKEFRVLVAEKRKNRIKV
jgi:hypothetical protein